MASFAEESLRLVAHIDQKAHDQILWQRAFGEDMKRFVEMARAIFDKDGNFKLTNAQAINKDTIFKIVTNFDPRIEIVGLRIRVANDNASISGVDLADSDYQVETMIETKPIAEFNEAYMTRRLAMIFDTIERRG